jgi:murein DD-endopeptidase MepM/ murein hydrolase activator NlpD
MLELHSPLKTPKRGSKIYSVSVNQLFGANIELYKQFGLNSGHNGIDFGIGRAFGYQDIIKIEYGASIVAAHDGTVVRTVFEEPMSTKGNGVYIQYVDGNTIYRSVYWHLCEIKVKTGDVVKCGQTIGYMGNSGRCFPAPTTEQPYLGTHLHFGVYKWTIVDGKWIPDNTDFGGAIDPMPLFSGETILFQFNEYIESNTLERLKVLFYPILWMIQRIQSSLKR